MALLLTGIGVEEVVVETTPLDPVGSTGVALRGVTFSEVEEEPLNGKESAKPITDLLLLP